MQCGLGHWVLGEWDRTEHLEGVWVEDFLVVSLDNGEALPFKDPLG